MEHEDLSSERARFAAVMSRQTTDWNLIDLFRRLATSDKFSDAARPYCYADLCVEAAKRVTDKSVPALMQAVEQFNVAKRVNYALQEVDAAVALRGLVMRALLQAERTVDPLMKVFLWAERTGITPNMAFTIGRAIEAGMAMDVADDLCDIVVYTYYPTLVRPEARQPAIHQPEALAA